MITALKEYYETVWKPSWQWIKKHWKGYSVFVVGLAVLAAIPCFRMYLGYCDTEY